MELIKQAAHLVAEAHKLRNEEKVDDAFHAFDKAAGLYQSAGEYLKAALCFSSASKCWNIHTGSQPMRNSATRNEYAA